MKVGLLVLFLAVFARLTAEDLEPPALEAAKSLAPLLAESIATASSVEAFAIDPFVRLKKGKKEGNDRLSGWKILGHAKVPTLEMQAKLGQSLRTAIEESNGNVALCFSPHHALRCKTPKGEIVFIVCFHCLFVEIEGFEPMDGATISSSQQEVWDRIFSQLRLAVPH